MREDSSEYGAQFSGIRALSMLIVTPIVIISAAGTIAAAYLRQAYRWLFYILKPLTTLLIIVAALLPGTAFADGYAAAICLGLLFSLIGDIWLMLPGDRFRPGLVSFLLARLCYIYAFGAGAAVRTFPWALLFLSIIAITALRYLWPTLRGGLKVPVSVYVAVTVVSTALPAALFVQTPTQYTLAAAVGAVLFLVSDLILAVDHFRRPFQIAHGLVLATYFAGQLLIASSVGLRAWSPR